jgi:hypothetical protein
MSSHFSEKTPLITQKIDIASMGLPSSTELRAARQEGFFVGNQQYQDFRGFNWQQVGQAIELEINLIDLLGQADDLEFAAEELAEEMSEEIVEGADLWGLEIGVASAVLALSALGCVPVISCNAGAFGGHHPSAFPYVAFFAPVECANLLVALAHEASVGLDSIQDGMLRVFSDRDTGLLDFAKAALESVL